MNVLFLEDKLDILIVVRETLIDEDITNVFCCQNISEAEDILASETIDLVIIDYSLGTENGLDFFKSHSKRDLPFILATGYKLEESDDKNLKEFNNYSKSETVLKPYDCKTLKDTIMKLAA
jgi:DNA-binding NtrC family response regulator